MRRFLSGLLGLFLVVTPVSAQQQPERLLLYGGPSWVIPGSSADLDFSRAPAGNSCAIGTQIVRCASVISTSRASSGMAQWADGHLSSFAANTPRITDQGLLIEQASTNQALYARDMTNATWVKVGMTAALTATGADNSANSASLLTATAGNATALQTLTITSQSETYSVYLERVTGTGNIQITENNGATWTTANSAICTGPGGAASNLLTTGYVRCSVEATLANPVIGIRIVTNGDAVNVDFNQDEELAFATSPIITGNTSATRAADNITTAGALLTTILNAKAARFVTQGGVPNYVASTAAYIMSLNSGQRMTFSISSGGTNVTINNGSNASTATIGNSGTYMGLVKSAYGFDGASITSVANGGTKATAANAWGTSSSPAWIGSSLASSGWLNGYLLRMTFGPVKGQFDNLTTGSNPQ